MVSYTKSLTKNGNIDKTTAFGEFMVNLRKIDFIYKHSKILIHSMAYSYKLTKAMFKIGDFHDHDFKEIAYFGRFVIFNSLLCTCDGYFCWLLPSNK